MTSKFDIFLASLMTPIGSHLGSARDETSRLKAIRAACKSAGIPEPITEMIIPDLLHNLDFFDNLTDRAAKIKSKED